LFNKITGPLNIRNMIILILKVSFMSTYGPIFSFIPKLLQTFKRLYNVD
jgi:hypothetical protein